MLDINVKTIDGLNKSYSVPDNYSVKQFKEKIANSMNIPVERQRLIFQGRELKDQNSLSDFDVNGKTLHLVQRTPPAPNQTTQQQQQQQQTNDNSNGNNSNNRNFTSNAPQDLQNMIQQIIGGLGADFGQNVTINATDSPNGMEVHINLENPPVTTNAQTQNEIRARIRNIRRFLTLAHSRLHRLNEIQSGVPLDDSQSAAIIVGSIHATATLSDGSVNTIAFDTNPRAYRAFDLVGQAGNVPGFSFATSNQQPIVNERPIDAHEGTSNSQTSQGAFPQGEQPPHSSSTTPTPTTNDDHHQSESNTTVEVLADVISSVMDVYDRYRPYLQQYHDMLINDSNEDPDSPPLTRRTTTATATNASQPESTASRPPNNAENSSADSSASNRSGSTNNSAGGDDRRQRFCNNVHDMMHLLGHLFHNLSDLHVNIRERPPRHMHTMNSLQHTSSTLISAIPVEVNAIPVQANIHQIPIIAQRSQPPSSQREQTEGQQSQRTNEQATRSRSESSTNRLNQESSSTDRRNLDDVNTRTNNLNSSTSTLPTNSSADQSPLDFVSRLAAAAAAAVTGTTPTAPPPQLSSPIIPGLRRAHHIHNPSNANSYDQFLPCNSVHFYNSIGPTTQPRNAGQQSSQNLLNRRRHPAGNQQSQQTPTPAPAPSPAANQNDLSRLLGMYGPQLLNPIIRPAAPPNFHQAPNIQSNLPPRFNLGSLFGTMTPNANAGQPPRPQMPLPPFLNIEQLLGSGGLGGIFGQLLNPAQPNQPPQARPATAAPGQPNQNQGQSNDNQQSQVANAILREAVSLLGSNDPNDQRFNLPLQDFLRNLGADTDELNNQASSNSSLNIFNIFFSSMTLGDMINFARGLNMTQVFERCRQPLREYIKRQYSIESPENETAIQSLSDRLYTDIFVDPSGVNIDLNQLELTDQAIQSKYDFPKSFEKLMKHHLNILITHVFDTRYDNVNAASSTETWSSVLVKKFHDLLDHLVTLCRTCIKNADTKFSQIVCQKLGQAVMENDFMGMGLFNNLFDNFINAQVQQMLSRINMNRSSIEQFIVYKKDEPASTIKEETVANTSSSLTESTPPLPTATKTETLKAVRIEDEEDEDRYDSASSTISENSMEIENYVNNYKEQADKFNEIRREHEERQRLQQQTTATDSTDSGAGSSIFPREWYPVIGKDLETQRTYQNAETNGRKFSDAYISGMPAKRRKILVPRSSEIVTEILFKRVLKKTIDQTELNQEVSLNELYESSLNHSELLSSFESELNTAITDRLRADNDFLEIVKSDGKKSAENNSNGQENDLRLKFSRKRFN